MGIRFFIKVSLLINVDIMAQLIEANKELHNNME